MQEWKAKASGSEEDQQHLIQRLGRELMNERTANECQRTELEDVNNKACQWGGGGGGRMSCPPTSC
jgi:hypothetical protein